MKNCWKMRAFGLVAVVMGVVLLGAVSPVCAGTFPGDGVDLPLLSSTRTTATVRSPISIRG